MQVPDIIGVTVASASQAAAEVSLPVIEAHCGYRQPARYDDDIEVVTRRTLVTPIRVRFDYEVVRRVNGTIAAIGHTVHAAVDTSGKPHRLPARVRDILA